MSFCPTNLTEIRADGRPRYPTSQGQTKALARRSTNCPFMKKEAKKCLPSGYPANQRWNTLSPLLTYKWRNSSKWESQLNGIRRSWSDNVLKCRAQMSFLWVSDSTLLLIDLPSRRYPTSEEPRYRTNLRIQERGEKVVNSRPSGVTVVPDSLDICPRFAGLIL